MSYSHSVDAMNGDVPIKEHWYRCDVSGEMIHESWPCFSIDHLNVHISMDAIRAVLVPLYMRTASVPFEWIIKDAADRAGVRPNRRGSLSKDLRNRVYNRCGKVCAKCGTDKRLQVDHIVPVSKGGSDSMSNLQVLCQPCNLKKGTKSNKEFMRL